MIYSDRPFSQKLERTEARANADFVETRVRLDPSSEATWIEVGGAYAMFDGIDSPLTQTFGLGVFDEITGDHLSTIEAFFKERGSGVFHEVSPLADLSLLPLLNGHGYRPIEMTSVMFREIGDGVSPSGGSLSDQRLNKGIKTRVIEESEAELWASTAAAGWATEHESLADFMFKFGMINTRCSGAHPFIAELDGRAIAAGMLFIYDDVAILAGASTIPDTRNRGAQNALLAARLEFAAERGCTLATMCALPGGQSQKNAQKNGFKIAYTRTKWHLPL